MALVLSGNRLKLFRLKRSEGKVESRPSEKPRQGVACTQYAPAGASAGTGTTTGPQRRSCEPLPTSPYWLMPQAHTAPSERRASTWYGPPLTRAQVVPAAAPGATTCWGVPYQPPLGLTGFCPYCQRVPSVWMPSENRILAAHCRQRTPAGASTGTGRVSQANPVPVPSCPYLLLPKAQRAPVEVMPRVCAPLPLPESRCCPRAPPAALNGP